MADAFSDTETQADSKSLFRFVAKQPILDRAQQTFGYELLFRSNWENHFQADEEIASRHLIDNAVAFGLEWLVGTDTAFMNCTHNVILRDLASLLPTSVILEINAHGGVDADLISACKRLKARGYRIAIDNYDFNPQWEPLLSTAEFLKVDFPNADAAARRDLLRMLTNVPVKVAAKNLETGATFNRAHTEGFDLFQGYFFRKPVVVSRPALASVMQRLRFLNELGHVSLSFQRVLDLLKAEPGMSYRILRLANAASVGARSPISNLRTALVLVGEDRFRKMAVTALTVEMCGNQPEEAHRAVLQRARFCELMAPGLGEQPDALYLFGMLSVIAGILDLRPDDIARTVALHPGMLEALAGEENPFTEMLACADSYDRGDWERFATSAERLHMPEAAVSAAYFEARHWTEQLLSDMR